MDEAGAIITLRAGAYRLREPLAVSSYGVLWRADGPPRVGDVALKLVNREQMERAGTALRAHWTDSAANELDFLSALAPWDQRHIVRLIDSGTHEGLPAIALELHGCDLGRHVATTKAFSFARALDWIAQTNQALATVHQQGFRYLDLKPGNLLLDARGRLKLADFGTIRPLADRRPHSYTGTARWQAPEQFFANGDGAYETGQRTDYFALGALFYYLATAEPLRYGTACHEAFNSQASAKRPPACLLPSEANRFVLLAEQHAPGSGHAALALLRSLLSLRPEGRPRHALQISRSLTAIRAAAAQAMPMRHAA